MPASYRGGPLRPAWARWPKQLPHPDAWLHKGRQACALMPREASSAALSPAQHGCMHGSAPPSACACWCGCCAGAPVPGALRQAGHLDRLAGQHLWHPRRGGQCLLPQRGKAPSWALRGAKTWPCCVTSAACRCGTLRRYAASCWPTGTWQTSQGGLGRSGCACCTPWSLAEGPRCTACGSEALMRQLQRHPAPAFCASCGFAGGRACAACRPGVLAPMSCVRLPCHAENAWLSRPARAQAGKWQLQPAQGVEFSGELTEFINSDLSRVDAGRAKDIRHALHAVHVCHQAGQACRSGCLCDIMHGSSLGKRAAHASTQPMEPLLPAVFTCTVGTAHSWLI